MCAQTSYSYNYLLTDRWRTSVIHKYDYSKREILFFHILFQMKGSSINGRIMSQTLKITNIIIYNVLY